MNISETALDEEVLTHIQASAAAGAALLDVDLKYASADTIVESIDVYVSQRQRGDQENVEDDEADIALGSLWGQQLVRQFGWEWSSVTFVDHSDATAIGVFSPDRSLAIYPFHFVYGCFENNAPVTILLAFNMLKDGSRIPELPPRGFENVMDNVHHVVPKD